MMLNFVMECMYFIYYFFSYDIMKPLIYRRELIRMSEDKNEFIKKSICAGMIIGLCCEIYKNCQNQYVGAFLFGLGLVTICMCGLNLFTGKVGASNNIKDLVSIFVFNAVGILIVRAIFFYTNPFSLGIGCGMLMQIGVVGYKRNIPWLTVMCIAGFLLGGFAHSIAKIYYLETYESFIQYPFILLGNIVGAKVMYYLGVKNND